MTDDEKRIAELEKAMDVAAGVDCRFDNWKEKCTAYGESYASSTTGIMEDQWQNIEYTLTERSNHYETANSSLEALQYCMEDMPITYPPPELLQVIINQFKYYMHREGEVSLEEVFFGPYKGESIYSRRRLVENRLYESFHKFVTVSRSNKNLSQVEIFDEITLRGSFETSHGMSIPTREFQTLYVKGEIEPESFLRNYRRWKNKKNKEGDSD